ncbi:MAG: hypothetical protein AAF733_05130 [Verrucomicrobiota bacterium]
MTGEVSDSGNRDLGVQPLDAILREMGLENRDLVLASTEQLTHKQVQKARKGRRVSSNIQGKIRRALERVVAGRGEERSFALSELFNYHG